MRLTDLLALSFRGLLEHKLRTVLTLLGVIIATVLIMLSLSAGEGLQAEVARQFELGDRLRQVEVFPGRGSAKENAPESKTTVKGEMSEEKRDRIKQSLIRQWSRSNSRPQTPLDGEMLRKLEKIPHVALVEPEVSQSCTMLLGDKAAKGSLKGVSTRHSDMAQLIVAGSLYTKNDAREILVHEFLAYRWGFRGDADVKKLLGRSVRFELRQGGGFASGFVRMQTGRNSKLSARDARVLDGILRRFPKYIDRLQLTKQQKEVLKKALARPKSAKSQSTVVTEEFRIVGVYRDTSEDELKPFMRSRRRRRFSMAREMRGVDVMMPIRTAEDFVSKLPSVNRRGFYRATVLVDKNDHVAEVAQAVRDHDLTAFSLADILERIRLNIRVISYVMAVLAGVALFVAALGIANTMVMSVLERTHEIGIMKAVGARDGDIQRIFLLEGVWIGFLGGIMGLLIGWGSSIPIDNYVTHRLEQDSHNPLQGSLFSFPWWLMLGVPIFASLITMLASLYPARRAARIDPIQALRHE